MPLKPTFLRACAQCSFSVGGSRMPLWFLWCHSACQPGTPRPHQRQQVRADGMTQRRAGWIVRCFSLLNDVWHPQVQTVRSFLFKTGLWGLQTMDQLLSILLALQTNMCALEFGWYWYLLYVPPFPSNPLKMHLAQEGASGELWGNRSLCKLNSSLLCTLPLNEWSRVGSLATLTSAHSPSTSHRRKLLQFGWTGERFPVLFIFGAPLLTVCPWPSAAKSSVVIM